MAAYEPKTWDVARAMRMSDLLRQVTVDGVTLTDYIPSAIVSAKYPSDPQNVINQGLRRMAYAILGSLSESDAPAEPVFANGWAHLGGSFNTKLLCWRDALGLKHIVGGVFRTPTGASNGEVIATLPEWMRPLEDGKVFLVATNTGVGRVDLIGLNLLWRTTGSYSTGDGYIFFDNAAPYR